MSDPDFELYEQEMCEHFCRVARVATAVVTAVEQDPGWRNDEIYDWLDDMQGALLAEKAFPPLCEGPDAEP